MYNNSSYQQKQQWAKKVADVLDNYLNQLNTYKFKQRVKQDAFTLLTNLPTLRPKIGLLTLNNGRQQSLLQLVGTIPMHFKGGRYNIPMTLWVVEMYPYHAPLCYVTPLQGMFIKPRHQHVDSSGLCYHPYLSNWDAKTSNLYTVVNILSGVFGVAPPIFSKEQQQRQVKKSNPFDQHGPQRSNQQHQQQRTRKNPPAKNNKGFLSGLMGPSYKEKLTLRVREEVRKENVKLGTEMDNEMKTQSILGKRKGILANHINSLEKNKKAFLSASATLRVENEKVVMFIRNNQNKEMDVDKLIEPNDELSKQILELSAQNSTIDDTLYYLGKALQKKAVSMEDYLSSIKHLATEQFLTKALLNKINAL